MAAERLQVGAGFTRGGSAGRTAAVRLHDLRHRWATMALQAVVHPKVVQEHLRHAGIAITLDTYSHVTEGLRGDAAKLVGGLIAGTSVSSALANAGGGDRE
jgi:integrase